MLMGSNFADGRGNATLFVGYRETDALLQSERDYSACTLGSTCSPASTAAARRPATRAASYNAALQGAGAAWSTRPTTPDQPLPCTARDAYNFGPLNYWQRPAERWSASAFMHYDVTDSATVYTEFMFHDDRTNVADRPVGHLRRTSDHVPCDGSNPLVSARSG